MELLLNLSAVDGDLVVVSGVKRSSICWASWKSVEDVVVEPLLKRRVLTSELDNFLSNNTSEEGCKWGSLIGSESSNVSNYLFINLLKGIALF